MKADLNEANGKAKPNKSHRRTNLYNNKNHKTQDRFCELGRKIEKHIST